MSIFLVFCFFRGTDQKLVIMAPVLLTGLTKIVDQPDEVSRCMVALTKLSEFELASFPD